MSQRLLETDFPSAASVVGGRPVIVRRPSRDRPPNLKLTSRPLSTGGGGSMPKNPMMASEWQYEPSLASRTGSMSRVQTSFAVTPNSTAVTTLEAGVLGRTGSLRKAFTTSDEDEDVEEEMRPLKPATSTTVKKNNNSQSSTSDYHSTDENPNLLPLEHRELPTFRLENYARYSRL